MPVFPDVPSMIVPPGFSSPVRSASSIIFTAMRSLIELPGLKVSIFTSTSALTTPRVMRLIRTIGVSPMTSRIVLLIGFTRSLPARNCARGDYIGPRLLVRPHLLNRDRQTHVEPSRRQISHEVDRRDVFVRHFDEHPPSGRTALSV